MNRPDIIVKSIKASTSPRGVRIDTLQIRQPRIIHADFMTHRVFSRNASSSRAIPTASLLERDKDIFVPNFRHNRPGMSAGNPLSAEDQAEAERIWRDMAAYVTEGCKKLAAKDGLNIHKQWANRPLEWFGYIDVVFTATSFKNFLYLRDHEGAQDEIIDVARYVTRVRDEVTPEPLPYGSWHLPYVEIEEQKEVESLVASYHPATMSIVRRVRKIVPNSDIDDTDLLLLMTSAARCCRVSYSKHGTVSEGLAEDMIRFERLMAPGEPVHASPMEHQARPSLSKVRLPEWGNLTGWTQFRKLIPNEAVVE